MIEISTLVKKLGCRYISVLEVNMTYDLRDTVSKLPHKPGVYRYFSADNELLYIGKAKDLKHRVSSYFQEGRPKNERLTLMVNQIARIEYTVVATEKESLILEANLIHSLQPRYNVLLKDDKSYVYVRITGDEVPGITLVRKKYDPQSKYYGPYTKKSGIAQTLRTLRLLFPYCQQRFEKQRPCSYYALKQCDGICIGKENIEQYRSKISHIEDVLKGKSERVEEYISAQIKLAADQQHFELASLWRDRLVILKDTIVDQKIVLKSPLDIDLITLITEQDTEGFVVASVFVQTIRAGKVINVANFLMSGGGGDEDISSLLMRFFETYYAKQTDKSQCLIQTFTSDYQTGELTKSVIDTTLIEGLEAVSETKVYMRNIFSDVRDQITSLLEYAQQNTLIYLQRNRLGQKLSIFEENNLFLSVVALKDKLLLHHLPRRIECYDISHISGKFVYGSMVVFVDGRPSKKNYKLFKTKEQNNDFENHKEVLRRRFERCLQWLNEGKKGINPWQLPNLIIVDGGKGQLSSDMSVIEEYKQLFEGCGYEWNVEVCSLAKREEEVFLPHKEGSILLDGGEKYLIQRIRDEAHRFAITANREARIRSLSKSKLDSIAGIGPKTKTKLLTTFGSVEGVIEALTKNKELVYELVGAHIVEKLIKSIGIL